MNELTLIPVLLETLKPGTLAPDDVYSHNSSQMLIKCGTLIDERTLERVKNLNDGKKTVFLAGLPPAPTALPQAEMEERRKTLEKETGYDALTHETVDLLSEISTSKSIERKQLLKVTHSLADRINEANSSVILSLVNALAPVDEYLQRHCINTAFLNGLMGTWMGLKQEEITRLALIGLLHDCGKALMPPSILNEYRRLTVTEFEVIKTHPMRSYELLANFPEDIRMAARGHHEKMNGRGYPDNLKGKDIPYESRVTTISDIYDALVAQRAYKEPRSPFSVLALLKRVAGDELDPALVDIFLENMPKELVGKQVVLSNGTVAFVRSVDMEDMEYPVVVQYGNEIKTSESLHCTSMY
ncbi:MAG: HD-GYP domain-containing protein [Defluviitaleaceae bacterium]|nr:HD-GYP domain-containing protein [Defluviitaleaceae bacterium]MCL2273640.1 HD-GYP domain-containing protein [Defluviitaleaceae bacterium]